MKWSEPWWLAAGLLACLVLLLVWRIVDARQRAALSRFISAHLLTELTQSISVVRRRVQRGLFLAAVALLFVALAGPLVGYNWEQISRRGNEIVFAIDTSRSMSTPDIKPNRLARAKLAIDDFVNQLDGDAVGIVAFAGSAFLVCPITLDYGAFHETLNAIDTNTIPRGGTNISSAIREAQTALRRRPASDEILILVTDGEDLEGSALAAAQSAKQEDGMRIFTVGVGTASGDLIPVPPDQGGGFVKDETGGYVKSHLDEAGLKAIAEATGGFYVPLGTQGEGLETIFTKVLGPMAKHDLASRQQKIFIERYQWPLSASLGALLASLLVGTRRRRGARNASRSRDIPDEAGAPSTAGLGSPQVPQGATARVGSLPLLLLTLLILMPLGRGRAGALNAQAAYDKGNFAAAEQDYAAEAKRDPSKPALQYNLGTAAYRAGQFPQAAQAFQQSITKAPSSDPERLADQEDAYYNLGNALYRAGQKTAQTSPQETLKTWNDAVKAYETALQLRSNDADSKFNRDVVKRKIAQLQQDQNKNQDKNDNSDKSQDKKNQDKSQGQDQSQKNSQNPGSDQPPNQSQGQSPPGQQPNQSPSQPPPAQPPNSPQNAQGNEPKPGEQPPPPQPNACSSGSQPPQSAAQKPPARAQGNPDQQADTDSAAADQQHPAGQMSREEARELLDSVKSDERRAPAVPLARRDADDDSQPPIKNW